MPRRLPGRKLHIGAVNVEAPGAPTFTGQFATLISYLISSLPANSQSLCIRCTVRSPVIKTTLQSQDWLH